MRKTLKAILLIAFALSLVAGGWLLEGSREDDTQLVREVIGAYDLLIGSLVLLAGFLDRRNQKDSDEDLESLAVAFLGLGALLPLTGAVYDAQPIWGVGFFVLLALGVFGLLAWSYSSRG